MIDPPHPPPPQYTTYKTHILKWTFRIFECTFQYASARFNIFTARFRCPECLNSFVTKPGLKAHLEKAHVPQDELDAQETPEEEEYQEPPVTPKKKRDPKETANARYVHALFNSKCARFGYEVHVSQFYMHVLSFQQKTQR